MSFSSKIDLRTTFVLLFILIAQYTRHGNALNMEDEKELFMAGDGKLRQTLDTAMLWPNKTIYYSFSKSDPLPADKISQVRASIKVLNSVICLQLVEAKNEQLKDKKFTYIEINALNQGCFYGPENLGYHGAGERSFISLDCEESEIGLYKGTFAHEYMHALGFVHEFMRKDRDDYIVFDRDAYYVIGKLNGDDKGVPFNFKSIMQYEPEVFGPPGAIKEVKPLAKGVRKPIGTIKNMGQFCAMSAGDLNLIERTYYKVCGLSSPRNFTKRVRFPNTNCFGKIPMMIDED